MTIKKIIQVLVILGVGSWMFERGRLYLWPYIIFFSAAGVLFGAFLLLEIFRRKYGQHKKIFFWCALFFVFIALNLIGSAINNQVYGLDFRMIKQITIETFLMTIAAISFLAVLFFGKNEKFRKWLFRAMCAPLLLAPFALFLNLSKKLGFLAGNGMFEGFSKNSPTSFAVLLLPPLLLIYLSFLREKSIYKKPFYFILLILGASLAIATGIRSLWLAMVISFLLILIFSLKEKIRGGAAWKMWFLSSIAATLAIPIISFSILPHWTKISSLNRVYPQITDYTYDLSAANIQKISVKQALKRIPEHVAPSAPYQERKKIWPQAIKLMLKNPFGLGTQYFLTSKAIIQDGQPTGAHNVFLEIALSGGFLALAIFLYFLFRAAKNLFLQKNKNWEWLLVTASILGLLIMAFFGSPPKNLWVMLALALSFREDNRENPA